MSQPLTTQSMFIPPPIDGLNLIAGPADYKLSEARALDNYRVHDFGIRQIGAPTRNIQYAAPVQTMFRYLQSGTGTERMLLATGTKIYRFDLPTDASGTDVTGAAVITDSLFLPCYHNKRIFLFNGSDTPLVHDLGVGNVTAFSASGPTVTNLVQACSYNHRLYIVDQFTTSLWYGGVDAISGTFTQLDLGTVLNQPGYLSFVFTWTANQGQSNQEFLVAVSSSGEVLLYSGDYPDAPNWMLIARSQIPELFFPSNNQPYVRLGTDVIISTVRGLVPLSSVIAGYTQSNPLYTLSRAIKDSVLSSKPACTDRNNPFLYAINNVTPGRGNIFCLNYERQNGAWSRIPHGDLTSNAPILALETFGGYLMVGTGSADNSLWRYPLTGGAAASTLTYKWSTPFFDLGSHNQKQSKMIRVLGRNSGIAGTIKNSVSISTELEDPTSPNVDGANTSAVADQDVIQELRPPGTGRRLSYVFSRVGTSSVNELNEIRGMEIFYEEGGAY